MGKQISYRSQSFEVAAGVTDREISMPHKVIEIHVPANVVGATIRFGDRTAEAVPLTSGGRNRFCFGTPPSKLFITAPGGDALTIFGSQEVEPAFFPFGSDPGAVGNEIIALWPQHGRVANNAAVYSVLGFHSGGGSLTVWGTKLGNAPDDMGMHRGRLCYEGRSTAIDYVIRLLGQWNTIQIPLTDLLTTGQKGSDFSRVYWDTYWIQAEGVPNTPLRSGFAYLFYINPGSAGWFNSLNFYAWGLAIADDGGVAKWHYCANRTPIAPTPDEDLDLGLFANDWIRFDMVHVAPTTTRRARFLLYADGILKVEREWQAGAGALPDYSGAAGSIARSTMAGESAGGVTLRVANITFRHGQLMPSGA